MCFGDGARPPLPPVRGGAVDSDDLVLTSEDGTEFGAFYAHPERPSTAGVVVLPDVRGRHGFYKELARRFAEAGVHAVAVDYFGRTAGVGSRDGDFPFRDHVERLRYDQYRDECADAWRRMLEFIERHA